MWARRRPAVWRCAVAHRRSRVDGNPSQAPLPALDSRRRGNDDVGALPSYRRSRVDGNPSQAPPPTWIPAVAGMTMWARRRPTMWGALPPYRRSRVDGNPSQAPLPTWIPAFAGMTMWVHCRLPCGVRHRLPSFPCRREPIAVPPPPARGFPAVAGMTMWARRRPPCGGALPPYRVGCAVAHRRSRVDGNPSQAPPAVDSRRRGNDDVGAPPSYRVEARRRPAVWRCAVAHRRSRVDGNPSPPSRRRGNDDVGCAAALPCGGAPPSYRRSRVDGNPSQPPPRGFPPWRE